MSDFNLKVMYILESPSKESIGGYFFPERAGPIGQPSLYSDFQTTHSSLGRLFLFTKQEGCRRGRGVGSVAGSEDKENSSESKQNKNNKGNSFRDSKAKSSRQKQLNPE